MTPLRTALALFLIAALLLLAGCESESPAAVPDTQTLSTIPVRHGTTTVPPVTAAWFEPEPVPETTDEREAESSPVASVSQPGNNHPEYIRMDANVYTVGEVVRFYLVNKGSAISGCDYAHPAYTVYRLSTDGTRQEVAAYDPDRSFYTVIIEGEPNTATGPLSLDTRRLAPGRYLIRFDCGSNVAREFVLLARTYLTGP